MFELSVAFKYLIPRWRQLSVSIISLISIFVIALVVWLIVVFFSVTHGLEKGWVQKLIALTAPVRVSPTESYYRSYYYLADSISDNSNYTQKTIGEKLSAPYPDPYNPDLDQEIPAHWAPPDLDDNGQLKDPVKLAFTAIHQLNGVPGIDAAEYEMTVTNIKLRLIRGNTALAAALSGGDPKDDQNHSYISQATYLASYDPGNRNLRKAMLQATEEDARNLSFMASFNDGFHFEGKEERADGAAVPSGSLIALFEGENLPSTLPSDMRHGDAILLPKSYREAGALIGDRGHLLYQTPTVSSVQEQRVPVYVAGFYDPGILPLGGKIILANPYLTSMIRSSYPNDQSPLSNGINVRFDDIDDAERVKMKLEKAFHDSGIESYWKVETYRDFEFTKDFLQQLRSEKNLFSLISTIVIIVACSNIVSMLIILVNNKKMEIGILRSMGASSWSIALIFGACGVAMGLFGSFLGLTAAIVTLKNLQLLIDLISRAQGFDAFNPVFYGEALPNEVSFDALVFVMASTAIISLVAGVVPAVKACLMRPSAILRSE